MEVRFKSVSVSVDIAVSGGENSKKELPTLPNAAINGLHSVFGAKRLVTEQLLTAVSGIFKPGTVTLVLGQPHSGKSTLLKLLSGRLPDSKRISVEGEVTYNGVPAEKLSNVLPHFVSYVAQSDKHHSILTVKETLEFAHACCSGNDSQSLSGLAWRTEAAETMQKQHPDAVINNLGLKECQNAIIGDTRMPGVTSNECKRVTTGEMAFGSNCVLLLDEISAGLDNDETFDIIAAHRDFAKKFCKTVVIVLAHPSPKTFALFDDVVILNQGRIIFHGPREKTLSYFESLGLMCPRHPDVAEFLLDLGTEQQYRHEVKYLSEEPIPRTSSEFAERFERSSFHIRMLRNLDEPMFLQRIRQLVASQREFAQSFCRNTVLLLKRQNTMLGRELSALVRRVAMSVIMGLIISSMSYQLDPTDSQLMMSIIFDAVIYISVGQSVHIPKAMAAREIFRKQRGANFFSTTSYVLSNFLSEIPSLILETVAFGSAVYLICGFGSGIVTFVAMLCLINFAFESFFFFVASISPKLTVVNPVFHVSVVFFATYAGFAITKDQVPGYLVWIYWINPVAWGVRALAANQYSDSRFDTCVYKDVDYCTSYNMTMGEYWLSTYEVPSGNLWLWWNMVYMAALRVLFACLSCIALEYRRYEWHQIAMLDSIKKSDYADTYVFAQSPHRSSTGAENIDAVMAVRDNRITPITLAFTDLWYSIPDPNNPKSTVDLLKGVSGFALPGTITALMGSSGAGKTTLMDVIAGRKTGGKIQGQILLNGHPATDLAIRRATGYCEQMDIHWESSTIREALTFSAFLRQPADIPDNEKYDSVNECLELLGLTPIADNIVRGSSVEQMKRLTIGVELAAQPSVLFLDEPTSGLDARSAKLIMNGVRKVADTGRTIICTIHQPSWEVFQVFDSLLLLQRGGETVFAGELGKNAREMIDYFESINGVEKLTDNYNPATWMLEVIGAGVGKSEVNSTDFVKIFKSSVRCERLQSTLNREGVSRPSPSLPAVAYSDKRAASELTQIKFLLQRFSSMHWRTASYNLPRFGGSLLLGLVLGVTCSDVEYNSYSGINSGLGALYLAMAFLGLGTILNVLPVAAEGKSAFYRERAASTYHACWYLFGSSVMEIPYVSVSVVLFLVPFFVLAGFSGADTFLTMFLALVLHVLLHVYLGELVVFLAPNLEVAEMVGVQLSNAFFMNMGFCPPAEPLPPVNQKIHTIAPLTYSLSIVSAAVFGNCSSDGDTSNIGCTQMANVPPTLNEGITLKEYLDTKFLMKHDEISKNFGILIGIVLFVRVVALLVIRLHQK